MRQFLLCVKYLFRIKNVLVYKKSGVTQYKFALPKDSKRAYISRTGGSCYHDRYYNKSNIISNDRGKTVNCE